MLQQRLVFRAHAFDGGSSGVSVLLNPFRLHQKATRQKQHQIEQGRRKLTLFGGSVLKPKNTKYSSPAPFCHTP